MKKPIAISVLAGLLCACSAGAPPTLDAAPNALRAKSSATTPIQHVVIVVQENRSFDNLFATFPGADGTTVGRLHRMTVPLAKIPLATDRGADLGHGYKSFVADYDGGKMDGFINGIRSSPLNPYSYVDPTQIAPYWTLAKQYVLADHMFATEKSASFEAHQDLIDGSAAIGPAAHVVDDPLGLPWGCDAAPGTVTWVLTSQLTLRYGPYPCFDRTTIATLLEAKHQSWKYYVPPGGPDEIWNGFRAIRPVFAAPGYSTKVVTPETNVLKDASTGTLPAVSWVIPRGYDSDHAGIDDDVDTGPQWVAAIANAIGKSRYWKSTAIVVVWDDWGGWYDHVPPPQVAFWGHGFRVPMLVVSAYARKSYVSHTPYEFGSILKFIEQNWQLGSLGTTDVKAQSIVECFDFTQPPRAFVPIQTTTYVPSNAEAAEMSMPDGD